MEISAAKYYTGCERLGESIEGNTTENLSKCKKCIQAFPFYVAVALVTNTTMSEENIREDNRTNKRSLILASSMIATQVTALWRGKAFVLFLHIKRIPVSFSDF